MTAHDSLSKLPAEALTARIAQALEQERSSIVDFVFLLVELRRRGLHLDLGYESLFTYCVEALHLERSAAYRRSTAAELIASFPLVGEHFAARRISLSALVPLKKILTDENVAEVLPRALGRTEEEVERLVGAYLARPVPRDVVRRVAPRLVDSAELGPKLRPEAPAPTPTSAPAEPLFALPPPRPRVEPLNEQWTRIAFSASSEFIEEFERTKAALSHTIPDGNFEAVFRECMRLAREACARKKLGAEVPSFGPKPAEAEAPSFGPKLEEGAEAMSDGDLLLLESTEKERSRYIPVAVRRSVWNRDEGCCAFVGRNGRRCRSTHRLEFDHVVPFALGGPTSEANLRLLCASHNQYVARRVFGERRRRSGPVVEGRPCPAPTSPTSSGSTICSPTTRRPPASSSRGSSTRSTCPSSGGTSAMELFPTS